MNQPTILCCRLLAILSLGLGMVACPMPVLADQPGQTIPDPGFRPENEYAAAFLDTVGTAKIAVLPTLVRRPDRTAHSFASQDQIVAFLNEYGIAQAITKPRRIDLGPVRRQSQWEIFEYSAESIAANLDGYQTGADYILIMELLIPPDQAVFGIEIYIVDPQGRSAFSFLLNSHHEMFATAKLVAKNSSEAARSKMIENATRVGLLALEAQIKRTRECFAASAAKTKTRAEAGILHDFESDLASDTSRNSIPLGFSTFGDENSLVSISRSDTHLPVPEEAESNTVLQLSLNATGWGGVINLFENDEANTWVSQDWSDIDGLSFWLYGNNSGIDMFVDVLDDRSPCSQRDDAERYTYRFMDDVAGWRLVSVLFMDMFRKNIGNGAPNDGLNLTEVHGWGIGTSNTRGPKTYYIDDFRLWSNSLDDQTKPPDVITHELFVETPIEQNSSRLVLGPDRQSGLVVEKAMRLMCACAELTTDRGFGYFKINERAKLSGRRSSFRITFFYTPPEGIPVAMDLLRKGTAIEENLMNAVIDAEEFIKACKLMESQSQTRGLQ